MAHSQTSVTIIITTVYNNMESIANCISTTEYAMKPSNHKNSKNCFYNMYILDVFSEYYSIIRSTLL